ncbi:MAG: EAL domain-containing protein [Pseudomonadota bacterium]
MKNTSLPEILLGLINSGVIVLDESSNIVTWNTWMEQHSGKESDAVTDKNIFDVIPEIKGSRIERAIGKALKFNCPSVLSAKLINASFPLYKIQVISRSARERLVQSILIKPFQSADGKQHCIISIFDISNADRRENALRKQTQLLNKVVGELQEKDYELRMMFENVQNGILVFDRTGTILNQNPAVRKMPASTKDSIIGNNIAEHIEAFANDSGKFDLAIAEELFNERTSEFESSFKCDGSKPINIALTVNTIPELGNNGFNFFVFFRDISAEKEAEQRLIQLAKYDTLTDLPNRVLFLELVNHAIATHKRDKGKFNIFFIDVDKFKLINDTYGHDFGDELLIEIATRLNSICRESDVVARWAGDEFMLLLEHQCASRSAISVAEKILGSISQPVHMGEHTIFPSCSIGIAGYPNDAEDAMTLIKYADNAMYRSKQEGRNLFRFFTQKMNDAMQQRLKLESEMCNAIEEDQLILHYQPQINVNTGMVYGVEALVRWQHPTSGLIYPSAFLPIAEESALIRQIGEWVFKRALEDASRWRQMKGNTLPISINVAASHFKHIGLVSTLSNIIASIGIPASSIILEITETNLLEDKASILSQIRALKAMGIRIALDDFGTGYSSLSYLRKLPIDILKIDRSFLIDATKDKASAHIISAIIELSHALNLDVIAEGIETKEQLDMLKLEQCDKAQGFYVAKPMELQHFSEWYDSYNVTPIRGNMG